MLESIEYLATAFIEVWSNPSVGPLPVIKIYFFQLLAWPEEVLSTPNIIAFLPKPLSSANYKLSTLEHI